MISVRLSRHETLPDPGVTPKCYDLIHQPMSASVHELHPMMEHQNHDKEYILLENLVTRIQDNHFDLDVSLPLARFSNAFLICG